MHQYIEAVEDLGRRTIGKSCNILDTWDDLANIFGGRRSFHSPFRNGLPCHFRDVSLLRQSDEPISRRQDDFDRKRPPSWTWAGWEAAQNPFGSGGKGTRVCYDQSFEVLFINSEIIRQYTKYSEERIRPRKSTLYGVQKTLDGFSCKNWGSSAGQN